MTLEEYVEQARGKPFVVCMNKFDYEDYLFSTYDTKDDALMTVKDRIQKMLDDDDYSDLNLIYHAYDEKGKCIDTELYAKYTVHIGGDKNE